MTQRRRWGTQTDASAVMAVHRLLSSAMRSNDDIDWSVHFLISSLPFRELRGLCSATTTTNCSLQYGLGQRIVTADMAEP